MQPFLEYVCKGLVDHPEAVTITPVDRNGVSVYELRVHPRDAGKIDLLLRAIFTHCA